MSENARKTHATVTALQAVTNVHVDDNAASMIDLLQEHLKLAREGQLRSLAVVSVSADGTAIQTQWSCSPQDIASLIGKLAVLTHDLMAARE